MTTIELPLFVANQPRKTNQSLDVIQKYTGQVAARVCQAGEIEVQEALAAAHATRQVMSKLTAAQRQQILRNCQQRLRDRREQFAAVICDEVGKTIVEARAEVDRAIDTFGITADECSRDLGTLVDLGVTDRGANYWGAYRRFPVGPVTLIAPFNFPLNLAVHKIAPAIAAGCPWILKPASTTPWSALLLGEILAESALPAGAFSILPCTPQQASALIEDPRIKKISFTGSPAVGWELKNRCGQKKITLELGGNAACIIEPDANLDDVCQRLVVGLFSQSGQSCISVQRVMVHASILKPLHEKLIASAEKLIVGDPRDPKTNLGPMINQSEAERVESWVNEAISAGARVLIGGKRNGAFYSPTLLENVPTHLRVYCQEIFGPVGIIESYEDFDDALAQVNASDFGLQAGVFTNDLHRAYRAWETLEVGGVVINDIPSWRGDNMPYGGVKASGLGREGPRFAIKEMTEIRSFVIRQQTS